MASTEVRSARRVDAAQRARMGLSDGSSSQITRSDIEARLARRSLLRLTFPPSIESRYVADTRAARAWTVRLTVPLGLAAYNVFTFVDATILPDLGWIPMLMRLCIITPIGFFAMWMCSRFSAKHREAFLSLAMTGTMLIPTGFMAVSHGPYAPYTMLVVVLVNMFGNMTMRLPFLWASFFSATTIAAVAATLCWRTDLPVPLLVHLMLATLVCVCFGIVANNQLERAERRSFLLTLRETLRADQLSEDRAAFSALSLVDPLTQLANRRAFDAKLVELWERWERHGQPFSLLMIDVDHFKRFNDHYGHQAGDVCLEQVATTLRDMVMRTSDLVARYGGEEFAVLLADCAANDASRIAEELRLGVCTAAIAHENRDDGERQVSVTIGLACVHDSGATTSADLLALADRYLYAAKRAGRNRVVLNPAMRLSA